MALPVGIGAPDAPRENTRPSLRMVEPFVMLRKSLLYNTEFSAQEKLLLLVIGDQAWESGTGECSLSHAELAALIGREERTVRALVKTLVDAGLIGQRRVGPTQAKAYWLLDPSGTKRHRQKNDGVSSDDTRHRHKTAATPSFNGRCHRQKNDGTPYREELNPEIPENRVVPAAPVPVPVPPPEVDVDLTEPVAGPSAPASARPKTPARRASLTDEVKAQVDELWIHFRARIFPGARVHDAEMIARRLKTFTVEEIRLGIDHFADDWWWMKFNGRRGAKWFFETDDKVEQWVAMIPRSAEDAEGNNGRTDFLDSRQPGRTERYRDRDEPVTGWPGSPTSADARRAASYIDGLPT